MDEGALVMKDNILPPLFLPPLLEAGGGTPQPHGVEYRVLSKEKVALLEVQKISFRYCKHELWL